MLCHEIPFLFGPKSFLDNDNRCNQHWQHTWGLEFLGAPAIPLFRNTSRVGLDVYLGGRKNNQRLVGDGVQAFQKRAGWGGEWHSSWATWMTQEVPRRLHDGFPGDNESRQHCVW